jgi:hypothetical protein
MLKSILLFLIFFLHLTRKQSKLDKLFNPPSKSSFNNKYIKFNISKSKRENIKLIDSSSVKPESPVKLSEKALLDHTASLKSSKINFNNEHNLGTSILNSQIHDDEYHGLSYKSAKATPIKSSVEEKSETPVKKKSIEKDFRIKYKTEKCKFYETNKECKFGDNVI